MKTEDLFSKAAKGNIKAFESLILQYEHLFYSITYHMMGNPCDAQDMLQEACIKIYKNLSSCRSAASFKSWACSIVNNVCIDELRKNKNKVAVSLDEMVLAKDDELQLQVSGHLPTPEEELIQNETAFEVRRAIDLLPEQYRILIVLRDLEDLSYAELAETLDIKPGVVKSRLSRARGLLRKILMEQNHK